MDRIFFSEDPGKKDQASPCAEQCQKNMKGGIGRRGRHRPAVTVQGGFEKKRYINKETFFAKLKFAGKEKYCMPECIQS